MGVIRESLPNSNNRERQSRPMTSGLQHKPWNMEQNLSHLIGISRESTGGQRCAERELGWDRKTIIIGTKELDSGFDCVDHYSGRGRHPIEQKLPHLLDPKANVEVGSFSRGGYNRQEVKADDQIAVWIIQDHRSGITCSSPTCFRVSGSGFPALSSHPIS